MDSSDELVNSLGGQGDDDKHEDTESEDANLFESVQWSKSTDDLITPPQQQQQQQQQQAQQQGQQQGDDEEQAPPEIHIEPPHSDPKNSSSMSDLAPVNLQDSNDGGNDGGDDGDNEGRVHAPSPASQASHASMHLSDINSSITIVDHPSEGDGDVNVSSSVNDRSPAQERLQEEDLSHTYESYGHIPTHTWTRRLDEKLKPIKEFKVGITEGIRLMGLGFRMYKYTNRERGAGRLPIIDPFNTPKTTPVMGVPIGGIGAGTIGRGWRGDFVKWQLFPGAIKTRTVEADQFSAHIEIGSGVLKSPTLVKKENTIATVLSTNEKPSATLQDWNWKLKGDKTTYHALYPRAWTVYEEPHPDIRLECRQISPVIPHNYVESSFPVGVFVWKVTNNGKANANVSIMFTFQNGTGSDGDLGGGHVNKPFEQNRYNEKVTGVVMSYKRVQVVKTPNVSKTSPKNNDHLQYDTTLQNSSISVPPKQPSLEPIDTTVKGDQTVKTYSDPCTFAIGSKQLPGVEVSYTTKWTTNSRASASALWDEFSANGVLGNSKDEKPSQVGQSIGAAVAAKVSLAPGETKEVVFALAWDIPVARFSMGSAYYKRYTKFYGVQGDAAEDIIADALHNYPKWEKQISNWQEPILQDPGLPDYYKHALFNELYYIADGGSVWTNEHVGETSNVASSAQFRELSKEDSVGHFAYLEGHEYLMFNTYDVHFYASFALVMLWPLLELSLQRDIALATVSSDESPWEIFYSGKVAPRKASGAVPHDLGNPGEDPWNKVNAYCIQDISRWKDLPSKFVLQVYRDYVATGNKKFLNDLWDVVEMVITRAAAFDTDNDGIVDNEGFPDQTYDTWNATGCSAYSGGLWIAALSAAAKMAILVGKGELAKTYNEMCEKGKTTYDTKLWNGKYYKYDCSSNFHHDSIMADQLAGEWYARACNLPPIVPPTNAQSALRTVFDFNVKKFGTGDLGAVNGMKPSGVVDNMCMQSVEVWTGTTYAVAAAMLQEGLTEEAFETARGVIHSTYEKFGYHFQTPEAWNVNGGYRSAAYMRPLAIWAIQWAWENRNKDPDDMYIL